jgi:hypothetical protein
MSEQIDWGKVTEFANALEEYEKAKTQNKKLFDPKELVKHSKVIRTINDPELGIIAYKPLTFGDLEEINKAGSNEEKSILALYKMLKKTYPDVTLEDVRDFGLDSVQRLLKIIVGPDGFLQVPRTSQPGLSQPSTFKG